MSHEYSVRTGEGGPALFKGENRVGNVLQWRSDSSGLSVVAGEITNLLYLNDANCDLPAVERALSEITKPS